MALTVLLIGAPAADAATSCGTNTGVPATFGTNPEFSGNSDQSPDDLVPGLVSGLGQRYDAMALQPVDARLQYRRAKRVGLNLCLGGQLIARFPRSDLRERLVGLSVNGTYVAWRVTGPRNTGYLRVGRVRSKRIVGVRQTTSAALRRNRQRNKRILVMPDGSAAWSLRENRRAGVWMWPAGRSPRKIASLSSAAALDTTTDVRIVDNRHVFLPQTFETARYGPRTPGRCPMTVGGRSYGDDALRVLTFGLPSNLDSTTTDGGDVAVICDRAVGDYIRVLGIGSSNSSQYGTSRETAVRILRTAGVFLTVRTRVVDSVLSGYFIDALPETSDPAEINRGEAGSASYDPAIATTTLPATSFGPQIIPGAVSWTTVRKDKTNYWVGTDLWLADRRGTRRVGFTTSTPGQLPARDPDIRLDRTSLSWNDGATVQRVPVAPTPDAIDVVTPPTN